MVAVVVVEEVQSDADTPSTATLAEGTLPACREPFVERRMDLALEGRVVFAANQARRVR